MTARPGAHPAARGLIEDLMPGGACSDIHPNVVAKYFTANVEKERFEAKTAVAICSRCPVQQECLERVVKGPPMRQRGEVLRYGIIGGMTATQIARIQDWEAYDRGETDTPPKQSRVKRYVSKVPKRLPVTDGSAARIADLTFEERVFLIFRDVKDGKYQKLNDAVRDIAALHDADLLAQQGQLGKTGQSLLNYDLRRVAARPGRKK